MQKLTAVMMMICLTFICRAVEFKGNVIDAQTKRPLVGANVYIKGTTLGTVTNTKGEFFLKKIPVKMPVIIISYAGYGNLEEDLSNIDAGTTKTYTMEPSEQDLGEVVITATGTPTHISMSPVQTEVYTEKELAQVDASTIEEALTLLSPSVSFQPSIMGTYLNVNGMSKDYILILVDGRKLAGDVSGNADLSRINMQNVERVEVVKGASSTLYGSDAMGAVINIITKKAKQSFEVDGGARFSAEGEIEDNINIRINSGRVKSSTAFSQREGDGYQLSAYEISKNDTIATSKVAQPGYNQLALNQQFDFVLTKKLSSSAGISWYDKDLTRPTSAYKYGYNYRDLNFNLGLKYLLKNNNFIAADYYNDGYESSKVYNQDGTGYAKGDKQLSKKQNYQRLRMNGAFGLPSQNILSYGAEITDELMESVYLPRSADEATGTKSVTDIAFWIQDEWKIIKDLALVAGVRYNIYDTFGSKLTPKAAMCYSPGDWRFRLNYANGYKAPSLLELYYTYESRSSKVIGSSDLTPQTSNYGAFTVEYIKPVFSVSVTAYLNYVDNMIYRKTITDKLTDEEVDAGFTKKQIYNNMGEAKTEGVDVAASIKPCKATYLKLGYSYCSAKGTEDSSNDFTRIEKVSENAATCQLGYNKMWGVNRLNINIAGRYEDEKYFDDGNADAYQLWNLNSSYHFGANKNIGCTVNAGIKNIFDDVDDRPYGVNYSTLDPGRRVYVGLVIEFKK